MTKSLLLGSVLFRKVNLQGDSNELEMETMRNTEVSMPLALVLLATVVAILTLEIWNYLS
jgi:hypothetical protein